MAWNVLISIMISSKYLPSKYVTLIIKETRKWKELSQSYYKVSECFEYVENETKCQNVLSLLGKINVFKILAFSKIIHLTLVTFAPSSTNDLLNKIGPFYD